MKTWKKKKTRQETQHVDMQRYHEMKQSRERKRTIKKERENVMWRNRMRKAAKEKKPDKNKIM